MLSVKANSVQVMPAAVRSLVTSSTWYLLLASLEQNSMPTFLASGNSSWSMAACLSRGARSEVPEMLPPTVPFQSEISRAVA